MPIRKTETSGFYFNLTNKRTDLATGGISPSQNLDYVFHSTSNSYDMNPKEPIKLKESGGPVNFPITDREQYDVSPVILRPRMHTPGYFSQLTIPRGDERESQLWNRGAVVIYGDFGDPGTDDDPNNEHLVIRQAPPMFSKSTKDHFNGLFIGDNTEYTIDWQYPAETLPASNMPMSAVYLYPYRSTLLYQFRGSSTHINPEADKEKDDIIAYGLEYSDKVRNGRSTEDYGGKGVKSVQRFTTAVAEKNASPGTPTSPLHPFTRVYPERARYALLNSYNRTKLPIADAEFRKAFRYIFITRPECYLMALNDTPSVQALNDEDMSACWARYPHVLRALSPVYVTLSNVTPKYANWNWLLCNRVQGLSTGGQTLNLLDSMTKSVRGATVTPGKNITTLNGATLDLSFRDTKYFDVYEMLRIWMLYIHKRRMGSFFPSYNGYHLQNNFITSAGDHSKLLVSAQKYGGYSYLHPYDRALDYCASLYDIVTNETGTKILYWCKYYGIYPVNISNGALSNDANAALTGEAKITATFQYQYKRENIFKNLVEFNFNAGICDNIGRMREDVSPYLRDSLAYLNRDHDQGGSSYTNPNLHNYAGAASMFTGSPYIITEYSGSYDPGDWSAANKMIDARLAFIPEFYSDDDINDSMNLGITNEDIPTSDVRKVMILQANRT